MTSLLDLDAYPAHQFGALYHSRWRIEEAFRRIKHRLALEHLSGMSWLAAQQDFGAKVLCDNLNALAVHAASETIDPHIRARYFINRGDTFSRIKRTLGRWLLEGLDALDNVPPSSTNSSRISSRSSQTDHTQDTSPKTPSITRLQGIGMTMFC